MLLQMGQCYQQLFEFNASTTPMYPLSTPGIFDVSASGNTVEYGRSGVQLIETPLSGYRNLILSGSGNKSLLPLDFSVLGKPYY